MVITRPRITKRTYVLYFKVVTVVKESEGKNQGRISS